MASPQLQHRKEHLADDFDRVSRGYDLLCRLNPGYRKHLRWSAERMEVPPGGRLLDLCCGTGLSTSALRSAHPDATVLGLDASAGMLKEARTKSELAGVEFVEGDATDPAAYGAVGPFDGILMAYGLRNVPDPERCLANLRDLLVPGGTLCLHEYSVADSARSRAIWNAVTCSVVIPMGLAVTGTTSIFRYLRRSVLDFDGVAALTSRLQRAGFTEIQVEPMDGWQRGVVHSFLARRPG